MLYLKTKFMATIMLTSIVAPSFAREQGDEQFGEAISDFGYAGGASWQRPVRRDRVRG